MNLIGRAMDNTEIPELLKALKNEHSFTRKQAIKSLEKIGNKSVVPALIDVLLLDSSSVVRHAAALAFQRKLADERAVAALIKALKDPALYVRGAAAAALGVIKDKRAVPALIEALKDKEPHVRWAAVLPLAELGDSSCLPAITEMLNTAGELPYVKSAAKDAIKKLKGNTAA